MAKTSTNLRLTGNRDVLFATVDHFDGSLHIGTNWKDNLPLVENRKIVLSYEEKKELYNFLKKYGGCDEEGGEA